MNRAELVFPALILAFVTAMLTMGFLVYDYPRSVIAFPLGAAIAVCALCAIEIARCLSMRSATEPAATDDIPAPLSLPGIGWMFALPPFLYGLGFVFGPAAYLLACLRVNGFSWRIAGSVAAASVAVTWGLFIKALGVQLPILPLWFG